MEQNGRGLQRSRDGVGRKGVKSIPDQKEGGRTYLPLLLSAHPLGTKTLGMLGSLSPT